MDKPAMPEPKADASVKEKKKRTAKKKWEQTDEQMSEQKVDKFINIRQQIETKRHEIEDEVLDINGEFDSTMDRLRMYDQCLDQAVRLEQQLLSHVVFDDVDDMAQQNDLIDVIQRVDPIMITNSGLEPLNVKLTEFINNPVLHCIDSNTDTPATRSRTVTSTSHISPTFDDIKAMVEEIRAQGDCPRVDVLAPADNSTVYDHFVCKVLADLLDILKRKRYYSNLEQIERDVQSRQGQAVTENGEELGASGPPEQHDEMTESTAGTSTHEKILEAIQKGELQTEGEDAVADGEDVGEGEDDESHSEAGSDDYTDSVTGAVALQQHIVKADDGVVVMEDVQQQSSLPSNSSPCTDGLPSTSASQPSSSATKTQSSTSSSEKVRLQQHQLNKLFSSAARLRSSPPLEPSLSTLKPDLIDLTLEDNNDNNDDEKGSEISERNDDHDDVSSDDDDSDTVMAVADSSDLEIIEELNEDNDDEWPVETVSDASTIPTDALEEAKAMLNGGGRRKRKSEDEESDVEVNRKKRTKEAVEDTVMVDDEDDDDDVVVEDVGADDIDENGDEKVEKKKAKTEQSAVLVDAAVDIEDDEAPEAKKADDNGQQLMDEESIIYLSDG